MFIQTEDTPNPATLKFLPGRPVMGAAAPIDFPNATAAAASPLAAALFEAADGAVTGVFFGSDFIAVSKAETAEWQHIKPTILQTMMTHFMSGAPMMTAPDSPAPDGANGNVESADAEVIAIIKKILDSRVRPAVAQDGGDIVFHGFSDGVVSLHMRGACAGCPSATITLQHGIENLLKHYVPAVREVRAVV